MKKYILSMALLLFAAIAFAGDVQFFTISVKGSPVSFAISEHPIITYTNNCLVIKMPKEQVEIPVADITSYQFTDSPAGIDNASMKNVISESSIYFESLKAGTSIRVLTLKGEVALDAIVAGNGSATIDLSGLSNNIYIVRTNNQSFKIIISK